MAAACVHECVSACAPAPAAAAADARARARAQVSAAVRQWPAAVAVGRPPDRPDHGVKYIYYVSLQPFAKRWNHLFNDEWRASINVQIKTPRSLMHSIEFGIIRLETICSFELARSSNGVRRAAVVVSQSAGLEADGWRLTGAAGRGRTQQRRRRRPHPSSSAQMLARIDQYCAMYLSGWHGDKKKMYYRRWGYLLKRLD